jgi:hypothetical protein
MQPPRPEVHARRGGPCPHLERRAAVVRALPACPPPYPPWYVPARAALSFPCPCIVLKVLMPPLASRAELLVATCARRRLPPWPPPPSRVPASSRGKSTSPTPPLGCTATHRPVYQDQARPACRKRQPPRPPLPDHRRAARR